MGSITRSFANNILTAGKFDGTKLTGDIPQANLTANAPAFDDDKIVNDISTLGLRVHTQENLSASNTNSQYVDVFQDSTGIASNTNAPRNASEFISTVVAAGFASDSANLMTSIHNIYNFDNSLNATHGSQNLVADGSPTFETSQKKFGTHSTYQNGNSDGYSFSDGGNNHMGFAANESVSMSCWVRRDSDSNDWNMLYDGYRDGQGNTSHSNLIFGIDSSDNPALMDFSSSNWHMASSTVDLNSWIHLVFSYSTTKKYIFQNGTKYLDQNLSDGASGASTTYHRLFHRHNNAYGFRGYVDQMCFWKGRAIGQTEATNLYNGGAGNEFTAGTTSATGNFISNAITTSATTKMGCVITYQDNAGTNALNSDIVLQLSADNGSNFSTATLTALPDFSSGIKMAKVNDLPVTSGTQLKYKISFANQAAGSKEARIRGVSLNY